MPVAFSYIRWSSRAQGPEAGGDSLRRQLARAQAYADAHGLDLDTTHRDEGVSSLRGEHRLRGMLASFLNKIEGQDIEPGSYLLIDSFDRLGRESEMTMVNLMSGICLRGVKIVTLNDNRVYDEKSRMEDLIVALISISRAHEENLVKGERVRLAHAESKRRARDEGRVWHRSGPHWLRFDEATRKFVPIPERVAIIRRIFELMDDGMGTSAVAQHFNQYGVPTPKHGKSWEHSTVLAIARSRTVLGEYQPKLAMGNNRATGRPADGEPIPNYYGEPIVDPAVFARVQGQITGRNSRPGRGGGRNTKVLTNLFTGLVRCQECQGTMAYHNAGGDKRGWNRSSAFQCANARRNAGCGHKARYPYAVIEQAILTHIPDFDLRARRQQSPQETALTNAIAQRADLEQQVANLIDMAASGSKSVTQAILAREGELEGLDRAIKSLRTEVSQDRAKREPSAVQKELPPLLAALVGAEGNELYAARVRVSEAIRSIVDRIEFEISKVDGRKVVSVFVLGGAKTYGFDGQTGEFIGGADITPFISMGALDANEFTRGDPTREAALDRILGTPERNSGMWGFWKPFEPSE